MAKHVGESFQKIKMISCPPGVFARWGKAVSAGSFIAAMLALAAAGEALSQQPQEITIALPSKSMVSARPLIAQELGLFEKHGIKPKIMYLDSSANTVATALMAGSVQFAVSTPPEAINASIRGQNMVLIANNYAGFSGSLVLAKRVVDKLGLSPTSPIKDRLKALDGLVIGSTSRASNLTTTYNGAAVAIGANPRFTFMSLSAMPAALDAGAIDGFVATAPVWTVPVLRGTGVLWISAPKGELPPQFTPAASAAMATMRSFADANPKLARAVAAVYDDLTKAVLERPQDVKAAVAKLYPELDAATLDLVFSAETTAMAARPLTTQDITHEIDLLRLNDLIEKDKPVDPAAILWPKS